MPLNPLTEKADRWGVTHNWTEKRFVKWTALREKGFWSFARWYIGGYFVGGIVLAIVFGVMDRWNGPGFLAIPILLAPIAGLNLARSSWRSEERQYKLAQQMKESGEWQPK